MNIYLIIEDGQNFCIRAKTMNEAINICELSYLEDLEDQKEGEGDAYNELDEKEYYHEQILQSCSLVGQLKN